jgi:hypothetical protein
MGSHRSVRCIVSILLHSCGLLSVFVPDPDLILQLILK